MPRTDPKLIRQIEEAELDRSQVQAVFYLVNTEGAELQEFPDPAQTEATVRALLERVEHEVGEPATELNIFRNLASFALQASPQFVRKMIEQEEVRSARANR